MSRAYRITVKESVTREVRGSDEISTKLELLEILPPEAMAELLRVELKGRGFKENADGTLSRKDAAVTVTVDPCNGEIAVRAETGEKVTVEGSREAGGYDDIGPDAKSVDARTREHLRKDLEKKIEREGERLQSKAADELAKHLDELQPEIGRVVNKVTREALKQKAAQLGTIREIAEDPKSGSMTIRIEV